LKKIVYKQLNNEIHCGNIPSPYEIKTKNIVICQAFQMNKLKYCLIWSLSDCSCFNNIIYIYIEGNKIKTYFYCHLIN
jgi:hypothetical protein